MSQRIRRRKAGRSRTSRVKKVEKRVHRMSVTLTTSEKKDLEAKAKKINVPRYLLTRWKVTDQPIPRPPIKKKGAGSTMR